MASLIDHAIDEGHRAFRRTEGEEDIQMMLKRDFADEYEALEMRMKTREKFAEARAIARGVGLWGS